MNKAHGSINGYRRTVVRLYPFIVFFILLSACRSRPSPFPVPAVETILVTVEAMGEPIVQVVTTTPKLVQQTGPTQTIEPTETPEPRTLIICIGQEPDSIYPYSGTFMRAKDSVLQAIYDGPIDNRSYTHQAVILEKLPNLADDDAIIQSVRVGVGDKVVDTDGNPVILEAGVLVHPSGCHAVDCAIEYDGEGTLMLDQMVVTFKLLPGLLWSDDTSLTAADSLYSFELDAHPDTPTAKFTTERTAAYEMIDSITLQWTGLPGYLDATYFTNFWMPLPEHVWGQLTPAELIQAEESSRMPLGWGPYIIEEWVAGDRIIMVKNPNYFRADEGLPRFDHLVYRIVGQYTNTNLSRIRSGECDIVDQTARLEDESELLLGLQASGELNAVFAMNTSWEHVDFGIMPVSYDDGWTAANDRPDFFGDVRTRRAIAMCMDRQNVVDTVLFGQSLVPNTYLSPQHPLFNADVDHYDFDVAVGAALLEEVGWVDDDSDPATPRIYAGDNPQIPPGTALAFDYWTTGAARRQQVAGLLAASLAACGIQVNIDFWDLGEFFAEGPDGPLFGRRFDLGQFAWQNDRFLPPCDLYMSVFIPGTDIERFSYVWGGWNETGYANSEYDAACDAALQSVPGQASYTENHLRAQEIFAKDLPVIPLYFHLNVAATRPDLQNFVMDPTANSELWNIEELDY